MDVLVRHWIDLWQTLDQPAPAGLLEDLMRRYSEPQRHYHTLQHLRECLALFDAVRDVAQRPADVALALWFHDAVYDVHAHDNEAASARLAVVSLSGTDQSMHVADLVLATRHDAAPVPGDAALVVDIDLAILGAAPARFREYEQQIRAEYAHVPDEVYLARRAAVMRGFALRSPVFSTPAIRARYESAARRNLAPYLG